MRAMPFTCRSRVACLSWAAADATSRGGASGWSKPASMGAGQNSHVAKKNQIAASLLLCMLLGHSHATENKQKDGGHPPSQISSFSLFQPSALMSSGHLGRDEEEGNSRD